MRKVILDVKHEVARAENLFPKMRSMHEGYAILLEEVDELWNAIKDKDSSQDKIREEAIQVAAMAIRMVVDCIDS